MATSIHEFNDDARNENILIYVNGERKPRKEAVVSVFDSGFVLGDGVWAPYWYAAVEASTGFEAWRARESALSGEAADVAESCRADYKFLHQKRWVI
jgi:hypothetical protein